MDSDFFHFNRFVSELGLDYEMQNTMLQAAHSSSKHNFSTFLDLENFTASGEIWKDHVELEDLPALEEPAPNSSIMVPRTIPTLSTIPHMEIPNVNQPLFPPPAIPPSQYSQHPPARPNPSFSQPSSTTSPPKNPTSPTQIPSPTNSKAQSSPSTTSAFQPVAKSHAALPNLQFNSKVQPIGIQLDSSNNFAPLTAIALPEPTRVGEKRKMETAKSTKVTPNGTSDKEKKRKIFTADSASEESADEDEEEKRRHAHVTAEQKRRDSIKNAFSNLRDLLPQFKDKPNASKAMILKGAIEYISMLGDVREESQRLRKENEELKRSLGISPALNKKKSTKMKKPHDGNEEGLVKRIPSEPKFHHYFD